MTLMVSWADFSDTLSQLAQPIRDFAGLKSPFATSGQFDLLDECLLEGLLSRAWQAWSKFCRDCVIKSCLGTARSTGGFVLALPDAISEHHVSWAAIQATQKSTPPFWGNTNSTLRYEPTWGDVDVLVHILTKLQPNNVSQLLAAFSASHQSAKTLQIIRNGAAHTNNETLQEINAIRSAFIVFPINHPTHAMFWIEPHSSDFLIIYVLQQLEYLASAAIS